MDWERVRLFEVSLDFVSNDDHSLQIHMEAAEGGSQPGFV